MARPRRFDRWAIEATCHRTGAPAGRQERTLPPDALVAGTCHAAATRCPSSRPATIACRPVTVSRHGTSHDPTCTRTRTKPTGGSSVTRRTAATPTSRTGASTWLRIPSKPVSSSTSRGSASQTSSARRSRAACGSSGATGSPSSASRRGSLRTIRPSIARSPSRIATRSPGSATTRLTTVPSVASIAQRSNRRGRRQRSAAGNQPDRTTSPSRTPGAIDTPSTTYRAGGANTAAAAITAAAAAAISRRR